MGTVTDPVHGRGWNTADRWGGWSWREPRRGEFFRTCSFCGCIHPGDLVAEQAGDGTCRVCGKQGWQACFEGKRASWMDEALRGNVLTADERAEIESRSPDHSYDPGGWYASWADRKYGWPHKFYVEGLKPRDPSMLHCISSSNHSPDEGSFGRMGLQWHKVSECPPELIEAARAGGMGYSAENKDGWLGFGPRQTLHAKFYSTHLADPAVSDEVKEKIYQASGLRFTFTEDGRVSWCPVILPPHEHTG